VKLAEEGWNRLQEPERGPVIHSLVKRGRGGQEPAAGGTNLILCQEFGDDFDYFALPKLPRPAPGESWRLQGPARVIGVQAVDPIGR